MQTISCRAPYGQRGLGLHFAQVVDEARARGTLQRYYSIRVPATDPAFALQVSSRLSGPVLRYTPVRFSMGWKTFVTSDLFDRAVARVLEPADVHVGFAGQALHSFRRARTLGAGSCVLHVATAHVEHVRRQHALAARSCDLEAGWLNDALRRKMLKEYELADVIYVNSEYGRQSFTEHGVPADKLRRIRLRPDPRYQAASRDDPDEVFRVVYVGGLTVAKGVPLLIEAFSRWPIEKAELVLVGCWATRAMRRYIHARMESDRRIRLAPGDPLPELRRADVYVHPSFQDGFGYAPMEALLCGLPVIVTDETGMKEEVEEGGNGFVVPAGSWEAILDRLLHVHQYGLAHPVERGSV